MAVMTEGGVTTLKPTAWKWALGGLGLFPFMPYGPLLSLIFWLIASGRFQSVILAPDSLTVNNFWSRKTYNWADIDDFRVRKIRYGFVTAANTVYFTPKSRAGALLGKTLKALAGGTHGVPALGVKAEKLAALMRAYKLGAPIAELVAAPTPEPVRPRPAMTATARAPKPDRTPAFGQRNARPKPAARQATKPPVASAPPSAASPLVQEGGWGLFRKDRSRLGT